MWQLASDPLPNADFHGVSYPEDLLAQVHLDDLGSSWNARGLPIALVAGALDLIAPPALTTIPFALWASAHGYPVQLQVVPDGGHCPTDAATAVGNLRWLHAHRAHRPTARSRLPERRPRQPSLGCRMAGVRPHRCARAQQPAVARSAPRPGRWIILGDPFRNRVRLAYTSPSPREWTGAVSIDKGAIVSVTSSTMARAVGTTRDVPGSTAETPARREWFEAGDTLAGSAWRSTTGAGSDHWDMVTIEVEAPADATLVLTSPDVAGGEQRLTIDAIRAATSGDLPRTLDVPVAGGLLRAQILQSQHWWWSQIRATRDPTANHVAVWVRNVASESLDLGSLGIDTARPFTVTLEGREFTGLNTLTLLGDFRDFRGVVRRDGILVPSTAYRLSASALTLPQDEVRSTTHTYSIDPTDSQS